MENCKIWLKDHKTLIAQITCFSLGKIVIGIVQLPNDPKEISYTPVLIVAVLFYIASFVLKLIKEGRQLFRVLMRIYLRKFLIWIVSFLAIIFAFSLSHEIGWTMFEIICSTICQIFSISTLVILCQWKFIEKVEFIVYECILSLNIIVLGIKTVVYIEYDLQSPHKDIVLLNLTTQIALAILIMDAIDRSYSQGIIKKTPPNTLVQQELAQTT